MTYWHAPVQQAPGEVFTDPMAGLLHAFRHFPPEVRQLIEATGARGISQIELADLSPLPDWWYRRVALIGDAAHATSPNLGQGAAQAVEDAAALAQALAAYPDRVTALKHFQASREAVANAVVAQSRAFGELGQARGVTRLVRNVALSINPELARSRIEAFYS
ncbi:FAD-dependent monooxygenase [Deinococcus lacus]|uniref:FAD-dependent monooxygenase n=1 Tax=Deinococcus lacus TaxID=392561 RepID=A0ABW1Y8N6_9DEIO